MANDVTRDWFEFEANGWVVRYCRAVATENPITSQAHESLSANFRWARQGQQVLLQGDVRMGAGQLSAIEAKERLRMLASKSPSAPLCDPIDSGELAAALGQFDFVWSQERNQWQTLCVRRDGSHCEVAAEAVPHGIRLVAVLANCEEVLDDCCRNALVCFLGWANGQLRFVRTMLDSQRVRVESTAMGDRLDAELADSLEAVVAACSVLSSGVHALTIPNVARAYLAQVEGAVTR